ncbi:hypothetical protein RDV89_09195 [Nocardioides zeae]|uniref:Uncharacterized protein n=1 Tax=Nocardioides imazamoxiresistens TaxID=3231893 RepID=A0ABU3PWH9_9ACTN|nr:hypothetical protein [Nocardioides zeae]MDT9593241.1 hypothetical protein [Nocardioides zeae]
MNVDAAVLDGEGRLRIEASQPVHLLVLSADPRTGDGAFLSLEARRGTNVVRLPLDRPGVSVEVVDVATGAVYARLGAPED